MTKLDHASTWFDIPVLDIGRAMKFYSTILEIEMELLSFPNGLKMATFPVQDGCNTGALAFHADHYVPSKVGSLIYLNGNPDLQLVLNKIAHAGGKILMPKSLITEHWGYMAMFEDTEGNRVALHSKS